MTFTFEIPFETDADRYREGWDRIFGKKEEAKPERQYRCLGCFDTGVIKHHDGIGYRFADCPCLEAPA